MLSIGISIPLSFKNLCIALLAAGGLAVNINISLVPNLAASFLAFSNNGAILPSITLLNCEKSNV